MKSFMIKAKKFIKDTKGQAAMETIIFAWLLFMPMAFWMLQFSYIFAVQENLSVVTSYGVFTYSTGANKSSTAAKINNVLQYIGPMPERQVNIGGTTYPGQDGFNNFPPEMENKPSGFPMPGVNISITAIIKPISKLLSNFGFDYGTDEKVFRVNATSHTSQTFKFSNLF